MSLAMAVGPALGLYLITYSGYPALFITSLVLSVGCLFCVLFVNYENKSKMMYEHEAVHRPHRDELPENRAGMRIDALKELLYEKTAVPLSLVMLLIALTVGGISTFIPALGASGYRQYRHVFYDLRYCNDLYKIFSGKLADRIGVTRMLLPAMSACLFSTLTCGSAFP
jgi:MFS family permease